MDVGLTDWLDLLNTRSVNLDEDLTKFRSLKNPWELTLENANGEEVPVAFLKLLRETVTKIEDN